MAANMSPLELIEAMWPSLTPKDLEQLRQKLRVQLAPLPKFIQDPCTTQGHKYIKVKVEPAGWFVRGKIYAPEAVYLVCLKCGKDLIK